MATRSEYDNFLYFEDFVPGQSYELGSYTVSREQMLAYAREFDPQYFHIDEEAAKSSRFGDIVASGWHTGSILMRLFVDGLLHRTASIAAPGLDEVKWANPVRAGDTLTGTCLIERTRESKAGPNSGWSLCTSSYPISMAMRLCWFEIGDVRAPPNVLVMSAMSACRRARISAS